MMAKGKVIGPDKQPVYRFLVENSPVKGEVSWNFEKFLVDRQGRVVGRFDPAVSPGDPKLVTQLETLLAARK
jgi:glutathione peroxidase